MGGGFAKQSALPQGFQDQGYVALFEIAHAAVNELCAAARCAPGEVGLLQDERAVAAGRGVHAYAQSGCASSNDEEIPLVFGRRYLVESLLAFHPLTDFRLERICVSRILVRFKWSLTLSLSRE